MNRLLLSNHIFNKGPQAQHEPHEQLGGACPLDYPLSGSRCPTQGCTLFENITLKDIVIEDPILSPGVLLGNETNPMRNIKFDNVTVNVPFKNRVHHGRLPFHQVHFPYAGKYKCDNVVGTCHRCKPVPDCLEQGVLLEETEEEKKNAHLRRQTQSILIFMLK